MSDASVLGVIYQLARESLAKRDEIIRAGWAIADMPHDAEVRAALAASPAPEPTPGLREAARTFIERNARRMDPDKPPFMADTDEVILYGTAGEFRDLRAAAPSVEPERYGHNEGCPAIELRGNCTCVLPPASPEPTPGLRARIETLIAAYSEDAIWQDQVPYLVRTQVVDDLRAALAASPAPEPTGLDVETVEYLAWAEEDVPPGRAFEDWHDKGTTLLRALAARLAGTGDEPR